MECQRLDTCQARIAGGLLPRRVWAALLLRWGAAANRNLGLAGLAAVLPCSALIAVGSAGVAEPPIGSFGDNRCLMIQPAKVLKQKHRRGRPGSTGGVGSGMEVFTSPACRVASRLPGYPRGW